MHLGARLCRLKQEQRKFFYHAFKLYNKYTKEQQLWGDCDSFSSLLKRLEVTQKSERDIFEKVRYSKIYVDEVQAYTQAEIRGVGSCCC
eukprot:scaffold2613_cov188-Amphora_coffeaeformis.AAC.8